MMIKFNKENTLNIRHKFKDEAIYELDIFINDCLNLNILDVKIIHGKKGGILREAVR